MDFDFTPTSMAMLRQARDQTLVVLLSRIEISVVEGAAFRIAPPVCEARVFPAPGFEAALLFVVRSAGESVLRHNAGLKGVGERKNQVERTARCPPFQTLPQATRQPTQAVRQFPGAAPAA